MKKLLALFATIVVLGFPLFASAQFTTTQGGTGLSTYASGDIIYAGGTNPIRFTKLGIGSNGNCLIVSGGFPAWLTCGSSSGGTGTVSTSSPETATQIPFWTSTNGTPALLSGGNSGFTFNNALSRLTVTNASTTNLSAGSFNATGLVTCNSANSALLWAGGVFGCNTISSTGGNSKFATTTNGTGIYPNGGVGTGLIVGGTSTSTVTNFEVDGNSYISKYLRVGTTTNLSTDSDIAIGGQPSQPFPEMDYLYDLQNGGQFNFMTEPDAKQRWAFGANAPSYSDGHTSGNSFWIYQGINSAGSTINNYRLFINDAGNVGIKTTTPNFDFEVQGTSSTTNSYATNATSTNFFATTASSTNLFATAFKSNSITIPVLGIPAGQFAAYDPTGKLIATTTPSGGSGSGNSKWATSTDNTSIYNNGLGKVGIGTSTPFSALSIATTTVSNAAFPIGLNVGPNGLVSGNSNGTLIGANTQAGYAGDLVNLQINGTPYFSVSAGASDAVFKNRVLSTLSGFQAETGSLFSWNSKGGIGAPGNGIFELQNSTGNDFTRLQFGGTTSSFPALGVNTATQSVYVGLADGTMGGKFGIGTSTPQSPLSVATSTGTVTASKPIGLAIGPNGLVSGSAAGTIIGSNTQAGFTGNFVDFQNNGTSEFTINSNGGVGVRGLGSTGGNTISSDGTIQSSGGDMSSSGGGGFFRWGANSKMISPSDGVIEFSNAAVTDFGRLQLGGTTSAFPSLKRNGTGIQFRLADDSAFASTTASTFGAGTTTSNALFGAQGTSGSTAKYADFASSTGSSVFSVAPSATTLAGIGTSTPDSTLDVNGSVRIEGTSRVLTASISGAIVGLGCDSADTASSVTLASTTVFMTTPQTYPGDGLSWQSYALNSTTIRTKVCADVTVTPAASTYNVVIIR